MAVKKSKKDFVQTQIYRAHNNTKELFKMTKLLTGQGAPSTFHPADPQSFCQQAIEYFHDKIKALRQAIDTTPPSSGLDKIDPTLRSVLTQASPLPTVTDSPWKPSGTLPTPFPRFTKFQPVSQDEVRSIIQKLGPASSMLDPIPISVTKNLLDSLLPDLTYIINKSLTSGEVPGAWKRGVVTPLLKKEGADHTDMKNLRPITLLCLLPRIIESIINKQIQEHLETHKLLHDNQSGFRAERGTETATAHMREEMLWCADQSHPALLILLDLSAAFDTVDHTILLQRLGQVGGVEGVPLKWLGAFLEGRTQRVKWSNHHSTDMPFPWGVPQGSALSPTLFNIYLRPLASLIEACGLRFQMFADDTQILVDLHKSSNDREKLTSCLTLIQEWMRLNKLCLNATKTELLVTSGGRKGEIPTFPWPASWGPPPSPVMQSRNLGVEFSHHLDGAAHASKIARAGHHQLNSLSRVFPLLTLAQQKHLYQAFVGSRICFGLTHLLGASKKAIFQVQKVQNRAIRLIFRLDRRSHITPWRQKLKWLSIQEMIILRTCCLMWKARRKRGPCYTWKWAKVPPTQRHRRLRHRTRLMIPKVCKARKGGRTIACEGSRLWNAIPPHIQAMPSYASFRQSLKNHLLTKETSTPPPPAVLETLTNTELNSNITAPLKSRLGPLLNSRNLTQADRSIQPGPAALPNTIMGLASPTLPLRNNPVLLKRAALAKRLNTNADGLYRPRRV